MSKKTVSAETPNAADATAGTGGTGTSAGEALVTPEAPKIHPAAAAALGLAVPGETFVDTGSEPYEVREIPKTATERSADGSAAQQAAVAEAEGFELYDVSGSTLKYRRDRSRA